MLRAPLLLLLSACVVDNGFTGKPDGEAPFSDGPAPDSGDTADTDSGDTDTSTTEPDCTLALDAAGAVPLDEACDAGFVVEHPWDAEVEWQYTSGGQGVMTMPVVAQLTDDDGDGDRDDDDIADIVFTVQGADVLVALSGDGSGRLFERQGFQGTGGVAVGDVDADGEPEIVAVTANFKMAAVSARGLTEWTSVTSVWSSYPQPTIADLDGDGAVEILTDSLVLRGADGGFVQSIPYGTVYTTPVVADLDRDGTAEILTGGKAFHADGALLWSTPPTDGIMAFSAVGNLDGDDDGEVVVAWEDELTFHDADGSVIRAFTIEGGARPGPPCIADVDGDGAVDVIVANQNFVSAFRADGALLWGASIQDGSGAAGCSAFDLDGDGAAEVLVADEVAFRIYDGRDGTLRFEDYSHTSNTLWEYPVVADVDGDGAAEVVVADNNGAWTGITVWGHGGDGWAPAGSTWSVHDYAPGKVLADGTVPAPSAPWLAYNGFRSRPVAGAGARPDLVVSVGDTCVVDCAAGTADLAVVVANEGATDAPATSVAVYAEDDGRLLATLEVPAIASGEQLAAIALQLDVADVTAGLRLVVGDGAGSGAVEECDEADNTAVIEALCP